MKKLVWAGRNRVLEGVWANVRETSLRLLEHHRGKVLDSRVELPARGEIPGPLGQYSDPNVCTVRKDMRGNVGSYSRNRQSRKGPSVHIVKEGTRVSAEPSRGLVLVVVRWVINSASVCIEQKEGKMNLHRLSKTQGPQGGVDLLIAGAEAGEVRQGVLG